MRAAAASLLLTAIASRFRGIPFRELSISVWSATTAGSRPPSLTWPTPTTLRARWPSPSAFSQTPYHRAALTLDERIPAQMGLSRASASCSTPA